MKKKLTLDEEYKKVEITLAILIAFQLIYVLSFLLIDMSSIKSYFSLTLQIIISLALMSLDIIALYLVYKRKLKSSRLAIIMAICYLFLAIKDYRTIYGIVNKYLQVSYPFDFKMMIILLGPIVIQFIMAINFLKHTLRLNKLIQYGMEDIPDIDNYYLQKNSKPIPIDIEKIDLPDRVLTIKERQKEKEEFNKYNKNIQNSR